MAYEPKRIAMAILMVAACSAFIFVELATRIGREMFSLLSAVLICGFAVLLTVWGVVRFLNRRKD